MTRRWWLRVALVGLVASGLAVLRDPPWLGDTLYGFYMPEVDGDGRAFRWTAGRASFFVPAGVARVAIDLGGHDVYNVTVTIAIDGRPADRVELEDEWKTVKLQIDSRPTSRRYRRIDLLCNRVIGDQFQRGVRARWSY